MVSSDKSSLGSTRTKVSIFLERACSILYNYPRFYIIVAIGVLAAACYFENPYRDLLTKFLMFVFGAMFSWGLSYTLEKNRRPKLVMMPVVEIGNNVSDPMTTVRVRVLNEPLKAWFGRLPAFACFGRIYIYYSFALL